MALDSNNDNSCYIRRSGPVGWTTSRPHHREALLRFLGMPSPNEPVRISVPHTDGGEFVASFRKRNSVVYQYTDEYGETVDIMLSTSSYAKYVNRIVDHYE